jgi:possible S14 family endopeptidase clpA
MSEWIKKFERDSKLKSAIVLSGNTADIIKGKNGKYVNTTDFIIDMLNNNFSNVILWDRISGINKLSKSSGGFYDIIQDDLGDDEESYDIGEDDKSNNNDTGKYKDINDFFGFMLQKINSRTCFILDYSDYIFSSNSSMSDQEKQWLTILKKSINENANYDLLNTDMIKQGCLVVILTQKLATVPSSFYVGDANVSTVTIPIPSRTSRSEFVEYTESMIEFEPALDRLRLNDFIDALDGFTLKDIAQIIKLSRISEPKLSYEKTINLYKYGESKSPWEDLSRDKIANIQNILKERVKG